MTWTDAPDWTITSEGYILSASGAKCARLVDGVLYLYDKRIRMELALSEDELHRLSSELYEKQAGTLTNGNA